MWCGKLYENRVTELVVCGVGNCITGGAGAATADDLVYMYLFTELT